MLADWRVPGLRLVTASARIRPVLRALAFVLALIACVAGAVAALIVVTKFPVFFEDRWPTIGFLLYGGIAVACAYGCRVAWRVKA